MQIIRVSKGIRGFGRITDYAIRWSRMVTEEAKKRARVIAFLEKHGVTATVEAFNISRRTLYRWKSELKAGGFEALNPLSTKPKRLRKRDWSPDILVEIKHLRSEHPNLGPDKIAVLLKRFCETNHLRAPKARTVARIIADAPDKMRVYPIKVRHNGRIVPKKKVQRLRKPKHFKATHPGHCGAFDTVEKFVWGCRRYIITFVDLHSRFSFAMATTSHASLAAKEMFDRIRLVFPYELEYILTDNGSEFMKHFDAEIRRLHKTHWHTYPKTPKMNAHCERYNRTIQEEFVDFHESEMLDVESFNRQMIDWLVWYNTERPHWSLALKSPIQFLIDNSPKVCQMYWRDTTDGVYHPLGVCLVCVNYQ